MSYLEAEIRGNSVQDDYVIQAGDELVLSRRPCPRYLKPYVPPAYRKAGQHDRKPLAFASHLTDEEKLARLIAHDPAKQDRADRAWRRRMYPAEHPSAYRGGVPEWYMCNRCGATGDHESASCLKVAATAAAAASVVVPLHKRKDIHGISRSELRPATEAEAETTAMYSRRTKTFWVRRGKI